MNAFMEAVLSEVRDETSALARARVQRQLRPEDAARRAGLTPDEVEWLEEGRLYRFRSSERATIALLLYATSLGIDRREARRLAGLPIGPLSSNPRARIAVAARIAGPCGRTGPPPPVARLRRGSERRRRHQLHPPRRGPHRIVRVPDQEGHARGPLRLPRDLRLLPSRRRGNRPPAGDAAWRHRPPASGRQEPQAPRGDRRAAESARLERRTERPELLLELRPHRLHDGAPDECPELDLEPIALPAVLAAVQVLLGFADLAVRQIAVEVRLHHLLALVARIEGEARHHGSSTAESASVRFSIR